MQLRFRVHLDDYHSTITARWQTVRAAVAHVREEIDGGYDVGEVTLDGQPLDVTPFCPRTLHTDEPCPNRVALRSPSRPQDGWLPTCITHDHEDRYNADSYAYKGD